MEMHILLRWCSYWILSTLICLKCFKSVVLIIVFCSEFYSIGFERLWHSSTWYSCDVSWCCRKNRYPDAHSNQPLKLQCISPELCSTSVLAQISNNLYWWFPPFAAGRGENLFVVSVKILISLEFDISLYWSKVSDSKFWSCSLWCSKITKRTMLTGRLSSFANLSFTYQNSSVLMWWFGDMLMWWMIYNYKNLALIRQKKLGQWEMEGYSLLFFRAYLYMKIQLYVSQPLIPQQSLLIMLIISQVKFAKSLLR